MTDETIRIYSLSTCPTCDKLKKLLIKKEISFDHIDVDQLNEEQKADTIATLKQLNLRLIFPILIKGATVVEGYNKDKINKLLRNPGWSSQGSIKSFLNKVFRRKING